MLIFICPFSVLLAQEYKNFHDLEKDDWMLLEMAEYYPYVAPGLVEEVPWRAENIRRSIFRATVTAIDNESITFEYRLESIYDCRNIEGEDRFIYYESAYEKEFSDSPLYHPQDFGPWKIEGEYSNEEKVLAKASYNLQSGELLELNTQYKSLFAHYHRKSKSIGLQNNESLGFDSSVLGHLNTARLIARGMNVLINQSNKGKLLTISIRQNAEVIKKQLVLKPVLPMTREEIEELLIPCEMRVIGASFPLSPNVKLTYSDIDSMEVGETKIRKFFIPYPCKYFLEKEKHPGHYYPWLISPGDSIVRTIQENKTPYFTGRGSEQNNFYYRNRHLTYHWATDMETGEYSKTVLDNFLSGTTGFWRRTFQLNMLYELVDRELFNEHLKRSMPTMYSYKDINWQAPYFREMIPLTDGWYKFDSFQPFLNSYLEYKNIQSATETINTHDFEHNIESSFNRKRNYYLNKYFLRGYPQQLINARNIMGMMNEDFLTESNTEYEDFVTHCPDQELLNEVISQHQRLEKLEKGKNIKDTDFVLLKQLFSQNANKEYVFVFMTSHPVGGDAEIFYTEELFGMLEQKKILSQINVLFVSPEKSETYIETDRKKRLKDFFVNLPRKEIETDLYPYDDRNMCVLLRKDGTILSRMFTLGYRIPSEKIISYIEEDMNRGQSDFMKGFRKGLLGTLAAGFFVLLFIKIYWDRKRKKEREERQIKELELKAIRSQMNPHFIFNALGSIQNLLGKGSNDEANDYLVRFSRLLRTVLNNSEKKLVPLSGEIEQICLYLDLEQLRFPFVYTVEIDESLEVDLIEIPGMMIQPFVENAVKHAIAPRGEGNINITMGRAENILNVCVMDDGPGLSSTVSGGFGIKAVTEEIEILKNLYHTQVEISIENRQDSEPYTGLKVVLAIPIG